MADLSGLKAGYRRRAARAIREASPELRGNLRQAAPSKSGTMASKIRVDPSGSDRVEVAVAVDYASFTRPPGTRPHIIRATRAKALAFFWPVTGNDEFFVQVQHPGYQPTSDWYGDQIDRWPDLVEDQLTRIPI